MKTTCKNMKKEIEEIKSELEVIHKLEKDFPDKELLCAKNGKHYKWFVKEDGKSQYLPKNETRLAENLALKKYYMGRKQELEKRLKACNYFVKTVSDSEDGAERILYHPEFGRLLEKKFRPINESLDNWQKSAYESCSGYKEKLIVPATQGKYVRSKSEAIIDRLLYQYHIPFHYEEKLDLNGIVIYPDFTIRHPLTGEFFYWEHFGLMDDADYQNRVCEKIKLYSKNGIWPSVYLIMTYECNRYPLSIEKVEHIIHEYFNM